MIRVLKCKSVVRSSLYRKAKKNFFSLINNLNFWFKLHNVQRPWKKKARISNQAAGVKNTHTQVSLQLQKCRKNSFKKLSGIWCGKLL